MPGGSGGRPAKFPGFANRDPRFPNSRCRIRDPRSPASRVPPRRKRRSGAAKPGLRFSLSGSLSGPAFAAHNIVMEPSRSNQISLAMMLALVACIAVNFWLFRVSIFWGIVALNVTKHVAIAACASRSA